MKVDASSIDLLIYSLCLSLIFVSQPSPSCPGAARDGNLHQLRTLVAEGWSLATRDQHGSNALLWAAGGTNPMGHAVRGRFTIYIECTDVYCILVLIYQYTVYIYNI